MLDKLKKNLKENKEAQEKKAKERAEAQEVADKESEKEPIDMLNEKGSEKPAAEGAAKPAEIPRMDESLYVIAVSLQNIEVYLAAMFKQPGEKPPAKQV